VVSGSPQHPKAPSLGTGAGISMEVGLPARPGGRGALLTLSRSGAGWRWCPCRRHSGWRWPL
jgi:hypothetical protein